VKNIKKNLLELLKQKNHKHLGIKVVFAITKKAKIGRNRYKHWPTKCGKLQETWKWGYPRQI